MKRSCFIIFGAVLLAMVSCKKNTSEPAPDPNWRYFEVGITTTPSDWRDSSFIVATSDPQLLARIEAQLQLPVDDRQIVLGKLEAGSGGYNKNAGHTFKWHFKEDEWDLVDLSIEIYDGRPYSDVDLHLDYWLNSVKRFSPWGSYIKGEITE